MDFGAGIGSFIIVTDDKDNIQKPPLTIVLGLSLGLLMSSLNPPWFYPDVDFPPANTESIIHPDGQSEPESRSPVEFHALMIEMSIPVQRLLSGLEKRLIFWQALEQWIDSFNRRQGWLMTPDVKRLQLASFDSTPHRAVSDQLFLLQGSERVAIKLVLTYGNDQRQERCLIISPNRLKEVERIEVLPLRHILLTPKGLYRVKKVMKMEATAYCPGPECTGIFADGLTSTGKKAGYGIVAVDPRVIPLGTRLYIDGYGLAVAEDVGAAIKGRRIDLCFDTHLEAIRFGRKNIRVHLIH